MNRKYGSAIITMLIVLLWGLFIPQVPAEEHGRDALGDVNNDGAVNVLDIVRIVEIILGGAPPTEYELWAGDVNADDAIDISDVVVIVTVILGTMEACPELSSPCDDNLTQCCPDTTSHEFTFVIDTLGYVASRIFDVAIISEDNVWVVGDFSFGDTDYNAARWNGNEWEFIRILFPPYYVYSPYWSIFAFSSEDIWMGINIPIHYDGNNWHGYIPIDGWEDGWDFSGIINAMWGTSSSNMYFVGDNGCIAHYDGENFTLMDSPTDIRLLDIYGVDNEHIWITGDEGDYTESVLLFYDGNSWQQYHHYHWLYGNEGESNLTSHVRTVWAWGDWTYIGGAWGIWRKRWSDTEWSFTPSPDIDNNHIGIFPRKMRGQNANDIMYVGNAQMQFHFNGAEWQDITDTVNYSVTLLSVAIKNNISISVGDNSQILRGIVIRGYRQ